MNYKYILRDIKLSKLTGTPLSGEASRLIKFWDELWVGMVVKIEPNKEKIECWKDDHSYYYFVQDDKNGFLWCNYFKVWLFFEAELGLGYSEIQELIQYMVGKTISSEINKPIPWKYPSHHKGRYDLKL